MRKTYSFKQPLIPLKLVYYQSQCVQFMLTLFIQYYQTIKGIMIFNLKQHLSIIILLFIYLPPELAATSISKVLPPLKLQTIVYPLEFFNSTNRHQFSHTFQQSLNGQMSISPLDPLQSMENQCTFRAQSVQLEHVSSHPSSWQNTYGPAFYSEVYVPSQRLLYSLSLNLVLTVYRYAINGTLYKQSSIQLQGRNKRYAQIRPYMVLSSDDNYLYIFAPANYHLVWRIYTSDLLGRIQSQIMEDFTLSKPILDTVSYQQYIYAALEQEGLAVFKIGDQGILELINIILEINQKQIFPVSLEVCNKTGFLFVLDSIENIYIFNTSQELTLFDKILFSHPQNILLKLFQDRIYFSFYEKQFAIMELLYKPLTKTAIFIRYFTSDQYISHFQVTKDVLLLLSARNLQIYPANLDPRLVKKEHNGIHQIVKGDKMLPLPNNLYLFIGKNAYNIYQLQLKSPQLTCNRGSSGLYLNIRYNGVSKSCSTDESVQFIPFYSACNFTRNIKLQIPPIQSVSIFHLLYIAITILMVIIVVGGCFLNYRRKSKKKKTSNLKNNELMKPEAGFQIEIADYVKEQYKQQPLNKQQSQVQFNQNIPEDPNITETGNKDSV